MEGEVCVCGWRVRRFVCRWRVCGWRVRFVYVDGG